MTNKITENWKQMFIGNFKMYFYGFELFVFLNFFCLLHTKMIVSMILLQMPNVN